MSRSIPLWSGDPGPTGVVSLNSGSINRSSGLRYGGPIRESEFGPKVWKSGLGTGVVGLRPGGPGLGAMTAAVGVSYRRAPPTILHRHTHIDQFTTTFLILMPFANLQ